jgi:magnesium-transporting ATPase (P-type)
MSLAASAHLTIDLLINGTIDLGITISKDSSTKMKKMSEVRKPAKNFNSRDLMPFCFSSVIHLNVGSGAGRGTVVGASPR